jgi:ELWxxDGT repeat protein
MTIYRIPPNTRPAIACLPASGRRAQWSRLTALTIVLSLSIWLTAWAAPATLVKDLNTAPFQAGLFTQELQDLTNVNGKLFFMAWDEINGTELWKSDGTALGTTLVKDIFPGA